jgi:hypothetical protein
MDAAATLENVYHEIMLRECKGDEAKDWENARHEIMAEAIRNTSNYYAWRNLNNEQEFER